MNKNKKQKSGSAAGRQIFLISFLFISLFLVAQSAEATAPDPADYAPNFWFDSEEQYYPANPLDFYYDDNINEISGEIAKAKYDKLSLSEKLNKFTVFYEVKSTPKEWVFQYWIFYVFNNFSINDHYGDFESVFVFVDKENNSVNRIVAAAHHGSKLKIALANNELYNPGFNHGSVLIEKGAHAGHIDGNNDGLVNKKDLSNWNNSYSLLGFREWSQEDKLRGVRIKYSDHRYNLQPLSSFKQHFTQDEKMFAKSSTLGSLKFRLGSEQKYATKIGGKPPTPPWQKNVYNNPEEIRPWTGEYIGEKAGTFVGNVANKIKGFAQKAGQGVKNVFKSKSSDGIGAGLLSGTQINKNNQDAENNSKLTQLTINDYNQIESGIMNQELREESEALVQTTEIAVLPKDKPQVSHNEVSSAQESSANTENQRDFSSPAFPQNEAEVKDNSQKQSKNNTKQAVSFIPAIGGPAPSVCGNGVIESEEECDDNNTNNNDGCSTDCISEPETGPEIEPEPEPEPEPEDTTAPETAHNIDTNIEWFTQDLDVEFTAKDDQDKSPNIFYKINQSEYEQSDNFALNANGLYEINFYSKDESGNKEEEQSITIKIDKTAPISTIGELLVQTENPEILLSWSGDDNENGSGILGYDISYKKDQEDWQILLQNTTNTQTDFLGEIGSIYYFRSRAYDGAGNIQDWPVTYDAQISIVDFTAPAIPSLISPQIIGETILTNASTTRLLGLASEDTEQVLVNFNNTINIISQFNATTTPNIKEFEFNLNLENSTSSLQIFAQDEFGNQSESLSLQINYDYIAPYIMAGLSPYSSYRLTNSITLRFWTIEPGLDTQTFSLDPNSFTSDFQRLDLEIKTNNNNWQAWQSFDREYFQNYFDNCEVLFAQIPDKESCDIDEPGCELDQDVEFCTLNTIGDVINPSNGWQFYNADLYFKGDPGNIYEFRAFAYDQAGNEFASELGMMSQNLEIYFPSIIINEIAWMGTETSAYDEWIELYNHGEEDIDLSEWKIEGALDIDLSGTIPANGYYLLERTDDNSVPGITADKIYTGSLSNSGEEIYLYYEYNNVDILIDYLNFDPEYGGWPAGDNSTKQTMERVDLDSWETSILSGGTPKAMNSQ